MDSLNSLIHAGRERSYLLHTPDAAPADRCAVVLVFHGSGTHAAAMREFCGLDELADREGFFTVYPNGSGRVDQALSWNAGDCCGHAHYHGVDDLGFCEALIDNLHERLPIDPQRIYVCGMSNGGMMAYHLAAHSARIAAVASVCGPLGFDAVDPGRAVPVLHFHGTADLFTPYLGGTGPRSISQGRFRSVQATIAAWIRANGCPEPPERMVVSDGAADGMPVLRDRWSAGAGGSEVILYTIENGGHTWPGRVPTLSILGPATMSISANEIAWEFFRSRRSGFPA